jgi:hypothetical protein
VLVLTDRQRHARTLPAMTRRIKLDDIGRQA